MATELHAALPGIVFTLDVEPGNVFRFAAVSRMFIEVTGLPESQIVGKVIQEVIPRASQALVLSKYAEAIGERKTVCWEETSSYPAGIRHGRITIAPVFDPSGTCTNIVGVAHDVTELRQTEEALRRHKDRLKQLIDANPGVLFTSELHDPFRTTFMGGDVEGTYGHEAERFGEDPDFWARTIHPDDAPHVFSALHDVLGSGGNSHVHDYRFRQPDGTYRWIHEKLTIVRNASGAAIEAIGYGLDISERKQLEESLREADARKDAFLALLSHELRNPLAPITNGLYILEHTVPGSEQGRRAMAVIGRQASLLTRLVDDLLDVTRISNNKVRLHRQPMDVVELVRRTVDDHRALFDEHAIRLELEAAPSPAWVHGDSNRLAQIVGNLLQNACKFTGAGGRTRVSVSVDVAAEQAVIRVEDTGVGIAPEVLSRLFQPFIQADDSLDRNKGGLGLGLAVVKGLVELHGGSISAHSAGLGQGAELVVRLPLELERAAGLVVGREGRPQHRLRVLIIEDNVDAANSLRMVLELEDHEVEVAYDGPEGIAKARAFHPDIVLCDIGLPGMTGYEVARTLRAEEPLNKALLVAVSGYAQPEDLHRAKEAGFERHLSKPPSIQKLEEVLARTS